MPSREPVSRDRIANGPCPGYVVDHIVLLKRGGPDDPSKLHLTIKLQLRKVPLLNFSFWENLVLLRFQVKPNSAAIHRSTNWGHQKIKSF